MPKQIPILMLILALLLGACQGAAQSQPSPTALQVQPVATEPYAATLAVAGTPGEASSASTPTGAPAEATPLSAPTEASLAPTAAGTAVKANCTVVSEANQPTQESPFAPVSDTDWVQGPPDARVTIIEYSDFM